MHNKTHLREHLSRSRHLIGVVLVALAMGTLIGSTLFKQVVVVREGTADTPAAMSSVNLMIDYGNGTVKTWNTVSWHESFSIVNLLEAIAGAKGIVLLTQNNDKSGVRIESIDGVRNDPDKGMRWQYWVNNTYEPRGAGKYYLKPGDIVLWKYVKEQGV